VEFWHYVIPELIIRDLEKLKPSPLPPSHPEAVLWRDNDGQLCAYGYTSGGDHWLHFPGLASFRFHNLTDHITAFAPASTSTAAIRDTYFRSVLPMVLQHEGIEVLHASAVRYSQGVVALCARSGTGKSTMGYGLSRRGLRLWSDDALPFEPGVQVANALALPFALRLLPEVRRFFGLSEAAEGVDADSIPAEPTAGGEPRETAPMLAVIELERHNEANGNKVEIRRLSSSQAFPVLLAHAYCFSLKDLAKKRRMMVNYSRLAATTPVFKIRFRTGVENLPLILDEIEATINRLSKST
jgi:hypothetical protein